MVMQGVEERVFTYKGLPCVIMFMPLGYRCGYVGIPKDKKVDSKKIVCHGDITYEGKLCDSRGKRLHQWDGSWIGFDCAHSWDGRDMQATRKYFKDNMLLIETVERISKRFSAPYKTVPFCVAECKSIVDQLIKEWKK